MGVSGSVLSRQTLEAIGSLVAIAIERAGAVEKLSRAEAARESEQLRSVLLDSVTHEFRSPLTAIKASVTSLLGSRDITHSPEERQELLTIINEESDRLNRLIGEAAEMAQLDANKVEFRFESAPVGPVVEEALDELKQTPGPASRGSPNPRRPSQRAHGPRSHQGGPGAPARECRQVLARRCSDPHHGGSQGRDQMLTINIADRGPGIDDFEQSLVFEKFYRGRNQRVQVHGTGMGLAICKAIVEAHGGRLGVTSQLGHGSVFYFSLPVG